MSLKKHLFLILLVVCQIVSPTISAKKKVGIPSEKDMAAYLMVYFKDDTHSLYMALSPDGYSFTDVNNGQPVIAGDSIALQRGIRDPHIMRGPDGAFYLAMTDLHIYAREAGYRETQWERDGEKYGWGNNRALVSHALDRSDTLDPIERPSRHCFSGI